MPTIVQTPSQQKVIEQKKFAPDVQYVYENWRKVTQHYDLWIGRCIENWRNYHGLNPELGLGQWPRKAVMFMTQQGRQLLTYNLIKPTIDAVAAGILQTPFDPEYFAANNDDPMVKSLLKAIKIAMYAEKEQMDWHTTMLELVTQGLVFQGSMQMVIDREFKPEGSIAFRTNLPGSTYPDPFWKTLRSKDCQVSWKESWMTCLDIKERYPKVADRVKFEVDLLKKDGPTYGAYEGIVPFITDDHTWGSLKRVIEQYEMVKEKYESDFIGRNRGEEDIAIPMDIPREMRIAWMNQNVPDWHPELVYSKEMVKKIQMVRTVCPDLITDEMLENEMTEIQIGRLSTFWWSATRANGEPYSLVDPLKDPQMNINFGESMIAYKNQVEGGGGAKLMDESKFKTPAEAKRFTKYRNRPAENFRMKPGALDKGNAIADIHTSGPPDGAYKHVEHVIREIWPQLSKLTPSSIGRKEPGQADVSGKLFQMMKMQSDQLTYTIHHGYKLFWNDVFEAYLMQAASTHSKGGFERQFEHKGESVTLNKRTWDYDGKETVLNDVSRLKSLRISVIISEKNDSPTDKMNNVGVLTEYMEKIPPGDLVTRAVAASQIALNIDQFDQESKDQIAASLKLQVQLGMEDLEVKILQTQVLKKDLQAQLAPAPIPAIAGQGGEGAVAAEGGEPAAMPPGGGPTQANNLQPGSEPTPADQFILGQ